QPIQDIIDLDHEHQVIDNFGASDAWSMQELGTWSIENRNRVADLLFSQVDGIGLSCWRFNIGGGLNPTITNPWRTAETFEVAEGRYDWTRQAGERWFLQAAKERGVPQFLAFVNSPPGRMTRNGLTFCNKNEDTTNLKPGYEGQYARYLADILDHFRTDPDVGQRIDFAYISPVNEPQWDWAGHAQEGNRASDDDIKRILRSLHSELERRNSPTQIAALESGSLPDMWQLDAKATATWKAPYGNYIDTFLGDPALKAIMSDRISYHDYGSDRIAGELVQHRTRLGEKIRQYPGCKLWMSEYCVLTGSEGRGGRGRDLSMNTALDIARIIHLDLTLVGVSAWQWWTAVSGVSFKDGLIYTDWKKAGDPESIYPARLLWVLGNYSRFVRPGMRRVEMVIQNQAIDAIMGSAYKNDEKRQVVAVYVNMSTTPQSRQLDFKLGRRAWTVRSITPYITSDTPGYELKREAPFSPAVQVVNIPARSVVTLVAQFT
ncbi:MAG TPA: glycoside hydrolase, partial [Bryobacteraceae bacterium]|nr:glycoside hydrolase [Bryobacteraceae bacterium]